MFANNAKLGLVGAAVDYLYGSNRLFSGHFTPVSGRDIRIQMLFNPFFYHPAVMFNLNVISRDDLRYDPAYVHNEDFDLFRRIANLHEVAFGDLPGLAWRQGHSNVSQRHDKEQSRMHLQIVGEQLQASGVVADEDRKAAPLCNCRAPMILFMAIRLRLRNSPEPLLACAHGGKQ